MLFFKSLKSCIVFSLLLESKLEKGSSSITIFCDKLSSFFNLAKKKAKAKVLFSLSDKVFLKYGRFSFSDSDWFCLLVIFTV